jgi:hypothetical protein
MACILAVDGGVRRAEESILPGYKLAAKFSGADCLAAAKSTG